MSAPLPARCPGRWTSSSWAPAGPGCAPRWPPRSRGWTSSWSRRAATSAAPPRAAAAGSGCPATRRSRRPARSPPTTWRRPSSTSTRSSATRSRRCAATPTSTAAPRSSTSSTRTRRCGSSGSRSTPTTTPRRPAAAPRGRSCEPVPLDARFLGAELDRLHPQYTKAPANLIVTQADFRKISLGLRTWRGPATMLKVLVNRVVSGLLRRRMYRHGQRDRDRPPQGADRRAGARPLRHRADRPACSRTAGSPASRSRRGRPGDGDPAPAAA